MSVKIKKKVKAACHQLSHQTLNQVNQTFQNNYFSEARPSGNGIAIP